MKRCATSLRMGRLLAWGGLLVLVAAVARAQGPRVLPPGQLPDDRRLGPLVELNGYFPFQPPATKEAWLARAEELRRQLQVATGLWPMPTATPAHVVVHGRVDREQYTVEKVFLESFPGHFVCGNLYRPKGRTGKLPAVLCPHGHWPGGRFMDVGVLAARRQIAEGAERFESGGRSPLQARCVQLARMGCIVLHYDMEGYADSQQLVHRAGSRKELNTPQNWGYFSPQAELRLETMMGLQTYNSLRALDWVSQLPEVDAGRIAVTGASGGGTQTFILGAVDPRPAVIFPAVMVGTAMQGGCTCENACYLRRGTGNVEIAARFAPKPLGMSGADDWTKDLATKGLPELKQIYRLFDAEKRVMAKVLPQFPHNYNFVSREVMYHWFNQQLKLGLAEPILEEDFRLLTKDELSVWDHAHPQPPGGDDHERALLQWITADSDRQMQALVQALQANDAAAWARFREVLGGAVDVLIGRRVPPAGTVTAKMPAVEEYWKLGEAEVRPLQVCHDRAGEVIPAVLWQPQVKRPAASHLHLVLWVSPQGKSALFQPEVRPQIDRLLHAGVRVLGIDLFGQGEFTADGQPLAANRLNSSGRGKWKDYAGYTYGYNDSLFAQRVHDILSAVSYARHTLQAERVDLLAPAGAGHWAAAARAQAGAAIDRAALDTAGFRFVKLTAIDDPDFLPGSVKYLDLPGMLALAAPLPLAVAGEGKELPAVVRAAYRAAGQEHRPHVVGDEPGQSTARLIDWLLQ